MKRSPMPPRKTPMKRGLPPKRKTWMRKVSAKKQKEIDTTGPMRKAYREEIGVCQCGECPNLPATEVHEIPAGADRHIAVYHPDCWLALNQKCHGKIQYEKIAKQIARKIVAVYDVNISCLSIHKRVSWQEVMEELRALRP